MIPYGHAGKEVEVVTMAVSVRPQYDSFNEVIAALEKLMGVLYLDVHAYEQGGCKAIAVRYDPGILQSDAKITCQLLSIEFPGYLFLERAFGLDIGWRA